eukprot:scaffold271547_cov13-Tisochrysis_lutea.AAC.1
MQLVVVVVGGGVQSETARAVVYFAGLQLAACRVILWDAKRASLVCTTQHPGHEGNRDSATLAGHADDALLLGWHSPPAQMQSRA